MGTPTTAASATAAAAAAATASAAKPTLLPRSNVPEGLGFDGSLAVGTNTSVILAACNVLAKRAGRTRCPDWFAMKKYCPRGDACPHFHLRLCADDKTALGGGQCPRNKAGRCDYWHFRPVHTCRAYSVRRDARDCKYGNACTYLHVSPAVLGLPDVPQEAPIPLALITDARKYIGAYEAEMGSLSAVTSFGGTPFSGIHGAAGAVYTAPAPAAASAPSAAAAAAPPPPPSTPAGRAASSGGGAGVATGRSTGGRTAAAPAPASAVSAAPSPAKKATVASAAAAAATHGSARAAHSSDFCWQCPTCTFAGNDVVDDSMCRMCGGTRTL